MEYDMSEEYDYPPRQPSSHQPENAGVPEYDLYHPNRMSDPQYREYILRNAAPSQLLRFSRDTPQYPELFQRFLEIMPRDIENHPDVMRMIEDLISDAGNSGPQEARIYNDEIIAMFNAGLSPNVNIDGEPIFLYAFRVHDYPLMSYLITNPQLQLKPEYLDIINQELIPLDQIRETMIQRLRPSPYGLIPEPSRKRTRYALD